MNLHPLEVVPRPEATDGMEATRMTGLTERGARTTRTPVARADVLLFAAWLLAVVASFSVLFVGEVLGQAPCNLCWFQRAFMFPLAVILGVAAWRGDPGVWRYGLPLAGSGALIALYHTLLYAGIAPAPIVPCTASGPSCIDDGMLLLGLPIPLLALGAFAAIAVLLILLRRSVP